jgi:alpha-beta hydrolase superfamily lysophospholipase
VTEPDDGDSELELRILQAAAQQVEDGTFRVVLRTTRGEIFALLSAVEGGTAAAVFVGGARGGFDGPANGIYAALAEELAAAGVSSLRLDYRDPEQFEECVLDALAGVSFLRGIGAERVAIVGHSQGGGVVIRAATLSPAVGAVVAMSSQLHGTEHAERVSPRPLLLVHGMDDQVLEATASQIIYDRAREPKELVLYQGAGHGLAQCRDELYELLLSWIPKALASAG